jgi:hypothetical protein
LYFFSAAVIVFLPVFAGFAAVADACRAGLALETGTMAPPGERTIAPPRDAAGDAAGAAFLALGFRAGFAAGAAGAAFLALGFAAGLDAGAAAAGAAAFRALGFGAGFSAGAAAGRFGPPLTPRASSIPRTFRAAA